jgi:LacI family transcriptional regulator
VELIAVDTNLTLEKIAELAGVSRSTASRVVRNQGSVSAKARANVQRIIQETGYQPNAAARSLAGHRTDIIGFVILEIFRYIFNDPYFGRLVEGVTQEANNQDQTLTLFLLHEANDIARLTTRILQNPFVDGLVISSTIIDNPIIPRLLERNLPFVILGRHENSQVSYVDTDNVGGAYTAVSHLLRLGYQRVGTITGTMNNYSAIDRLEGYKNAHRDLRQEIKPEFIHIGTYMEESGYAGMKQLLKQEVDAVFAASDSIAIGAMKAIHEVGLRIPEDVAIVGFDDLSFAAKANPPLTTIRQTIRQIGQLAVDTLMALVENKEMPPRRVSLPTELVIRGSCGAMRK